MTPERDGQARTVFQRDVDRPGGGAISVNYGPSRPTSCTALIGDQSPELEGWYAEPHLGYRDPMHFRIRR